MTAVRNAFLTAITTQNSVGKVAALLIAKMARPDLNLSTGEYPYHVPTCKAEVAALTISAVGY